jgi:undecaprenyl-diphosphatase
MNLFETLILGVVQGLTEFLPVSSSAHLVIVENILKIKSESISFEVFLHFGTFMAVVIIYRKEIWGMIKSLRYILVRKDNSVSSAGSALGGKEYLRLLGLIIIGSIPAGFLGLLFKDIVEKSFSSISLVSSMLIVTGIFLWLTRLSKATEQKINFADSIIIGSAQAFALLPGISRSGFTIGTGLFRRIDKTKAADFSFLLSLPAIFGATLLKLKDCLVEKPSSHLILLYLLGSLFAFIFGYLAIKFLLSVLRKGKFEYFGYYCVLAGILSLIFLR